MLIFFGDFDAIDLGSSETDIAQVFERAMFIILGRDRNLRRTQSMKYEKL